VNSSPEPVADGVAEAHFDCGPHCAQPICLTLSRTGNQAGKVDFLQKSALLWYLYRRHAREGVDILQKGHTVEALQLPVRGVVLGYVTVDPLGIGDVNELVE
jgi:hypothetical protein